MPAPVKLELPLLSDDTPQHLAIRTMVTRGCGVAAVGLGRSVALVRSRDLLRVETGEMSLATVAVKYGLKPDRDFELVKTEAGSVTIFGSADLLRFEVPAGYKQCSKDPDHIYDLDYDRAVCAFDSAELSIVYL